MIKIQFSRGNDRIMLKRVSLFLLTNLGVVLVLGLVASLLGIKPQGVLPLLVFAFLFGFGGAFISLMISKWAAKNATGARIITQPATETERWLVDTVAKLSAQANIKMPEVGIYEGEPNAFATGPGRDNSLVCVSTGLMRAMTKDEVEAVLGHEIAHVANGDMVTLTLIQGVVNTFVIFISRLIANAIAQGSDRGRSVLAYTAIVIVLQLVFGILASRVVNYFSRKREYRADAGAAYLLGNPKPMIAALKRLKQLQAGDLPDSMAAMGISDKRSRFAGLFSTHPALDDRIEALQNNLSSFSLDN